MIVINFKNYVPGERAIDMAKYIEKYLPDAIVSVPATDIFEVSAETRLKVYAQHLDNIESGRGTGYITFQSVKTAGAVGSLLNHSEHQLPWKVIEKTMEIAKKEGLKIILCTSKIRDAEKLAVLKPYAIAYEDPKLIASGNSVTFYRADEVANFAKALKGTGVLPLCGAGIQNRADVIAAKQLGCKGVLISSAIVNSKNPEKLLKELARV
ncbi:MAG: triose-phosphate isomerase [Nanoarchaeota archaeon]|nr:triose-phosphate isomerase [Nanoarchaeota archaeon]